MKISGFKAILKETIQEVFREELRDIILESLKSSKTPSFNPSPPEIVREQALNQRNQLLEMVNGARFTNNEKEFQPPSSNIDTINGDLGEGEVSLDLIKNFTKLGMT
jgi:hypothetical protein